MSKYIFNNADNYSYFSDLFNKYFSTSPYYKKKTKKKYTIKDELKPSYFAYTKKDDDFKSPIFKKDYTPNATDLSSLWSSFIPKLNSYYYFASNPSCDFYINNTPVKIHGNYIQIGADLIPKNATVDFFNGFSNDSKITVYNVIIEMNNIVIA